MSKIYCYKNREKNKKTLDIKASDFNTYDLVILFIGAGYGTWTHTLLLETDFESVASAIPPIRHIQKIFKIYIIYYINKIERLQHI